MFNVKYLPALKLVLLLFLTAGLLAPGFVVYAQDGGEATAEPTVPPAEPDTPSDSATESTDTEAEEDDDSGLDGAVLFAVLVLVAIIFIIVVVVLFRRQRIRDTKLRGVLRVLKGKQSDNRPMRPVGRPIKLDQFYENRYEVKVTERPPEPIFVSLSVEYNPRDESLTASYEIKEGQGGSKIDSVRIEKDGEPELFYTQPDDEQFQYFFHWGHFND